MVSRGQVYRLEGGSPGLFGVLVMTNDVWNRRMAAVGVVPIRGPERPDSVWEPVIGDEPPLQAFVGYLANRSTDSLGEMRLVLTAEQLARVEHGLADLLLLPELCATPPVRPPSLPGAPTYPRWGEIYYAGQRVGPTGAIKRYVVVSDDRWNATRGTATAVRTTTQDKRWGEAFPLIEAGAARACCGDATVFPHSLFNLRARPRPASLSLDEMAQIARGLGDVFDLDPNQ